MTYKPSNYLYPNFCFEACTVATFNANTTYAQYFQPNDTLNIGDNVTYTCKKDRRLVAGNLTRLCQDNGLWSGKEPICKRNYFSVSLRIKKRFLHFIIEVGINTAAPCILICFALYCVLECSLRRYLY